MRVWFYAKHAMPTWTQYVLVRICSCPYPFLFHFRPWMRRRHQQIVGLETCTEVDPSHDGTDRGVGRAEESFQSKFLATCTWDVVGAAGHLASVAAAHSQDVGLDTPDAKVLMNNKGRPLCRMAALVFGPSIKEDPGTLRGAAMVAVLPFYQEISPLAEDREGNDLEEEALLASDAVAVGHGHHIGEAEVHRNILPAAYGVVVHRRIVGEEEHISAVVVVQDAVGQ
jgi:hypothetical protein